MKKFFVLFLTFSMMLSFASCGNEPNEHESSDDDMSSHVSSDNSFDTSIDTSLEIQSFPKEKVTHDALSDGNYYLKVQTVSGNDVCIREIAAKGADVYSSVREDNEFEWYYSNGRATFVFDDEEKTYEIYSFNSLSIDLFAGEKESEGECVFFDVECSYIKYKLDDKVCKGKGKGQLYLENHGCGYLKENIQKIYTEEGGDDKYTGKDEVCNTDG